MPTGGGKTEAYLGLAALTMLYRRLAHRRDGGGTAVIMRYTLRLLTAQQLQRAASLLCALETLRRENRRRARRRAVHDRSLAWPGKHARTDRQTALAMLTGWPARRVARSRPFLLTRCPACATEMGGWTGTAGSSATAASPPAPGTGCRHRALTRHARSTWRAATTPGLPVYEVDEDLYAKPPSFLVATVDKFAQLAWNEKARVLFGLDESGRRARRAPDIVIQDELHLISGPLGSLVGAV